MTTIRSGWLSSLVLLPTLVGCSAATESNGDGVSSTDLSSGDGIAVQTPDRGELCSLPSGHRSTVKRFAVFSDPHFYDTALGTEGAAFQSYLASDRKMLVQSEPILRQVVRRIIEQHPAFVLVPGDLTKDGERWDHLRIADYFHALERAGIEVYVVPGNHDVMNPDAYRYTEQGKEAVKNVDEREFARIYHDFGYAQAMDRDSGSLSYLTEPVAGLWLLAIDSTMHRENTPQTGAITGGHLSPTTRAWLLSKLALAKKLGKQTIAMMHHGLVEHYAGQTLLFPDYVIDDYAALSKELAHAGLPIVFTGHFHANDVTSAAWDDGTRLTDVETGSLVTAPSPFRFIDYYPRERRMVVSTEHVTALPGQPDFAAWAAQFLNDGMKGLITAQLVGSSLVDSATAQYFAPVIAGALEGHYAGDEVAADATTLEVANLFQSSGSAAGQAWSYSLLSLHKDPPPADNDVVLELGKTEP